MDKAKNVLDRLSDDPKARELASWRQAHRALHQMDLREERRQARAAGREEGLQEGRQEGRQEGQRAAVRAIIERRFGPLTEDHAQRVDQADSDVLLSRIFEADTLETLLDF